MKKSKILLYFFIVFLASACNSCKQSPPPTPPEPIVEDVKVQVPAFSADNAYDYIKKQVAFGPRVNNTKAHVACGDWLIAFLIERADTVYIQSVDLKGFDGKILKSRNIIASYNSKATQRVLLAAHWDTRPFADQDDERQKEAIDGANDGASGVGVLLEIANALKTQPTEMGVDIILFDAEDYGAPAGANSEVAESYCLGSQYWSKYLHTPNYKADFGILLDMVGSKDATFTKEGTSMMYAAGFVNYVWNIASQLGYSNYFTYEGSSPLIDDHKYVNEIAGIPMLDIIHRTQLTDSGFGVYWHTHEDNINVIDKNTLKAVGETVLHALYKYDKKKSI